MPSSSPHLGFYPYAYNVRNLAHILLPFLQQHGWMVVAIAEGMLPYAMICGLATYMCIWCNILDEVMVHL